NIRLQKDRHKSIRAERIFIDAGRSGDGEFKIGAGGSMKRGQTPDRTIGIGGKKNAIAISTESPRIDIIRGTTNRKPRLSLIGGFDNAATKSLRIHCIF